MGNSNKKHRPIGLKTGQYYLRACYVCQSQSLNIHMTDATVAKLSSMHFYGWKLGLKTGQYYLRTKAAVDAIKFTVDVATTKAALQAQQGEQEVCVNCSG